VPSNGLLYPPASVEDIPYVTRPISEGGVLERKGMVEVISSLEADGRKIPYDIRMGVWVTVEAETDYIKNCFEEYNAHTDPSGRYFTLYKRWHLIGLEVGVSVASVALRSNPPAWPRPGTPTWWRPPSATSQRARCSTAKAATRCGASCCRRHLAAHGRPAAGSGAWRQDGAACEEAGQSLSWADVAIDTSTHAYKIRREMESLFAALKAA
jgi:predicted homoserine dehydrogenase-like protein